MTNPQRMWFKFIDKNVAVCPENNCTFIRRAHGHLIIEGGHASPPCVSSKYTIETLLPMTERFSGITLEAVAREEMIVKIRALLTESDKTERDVAALIAGKN